jgi:hypothetical protein
VTDYNFGTLIRRDCEQAYGEDNCILLTRVQFFGIEVSCLRTDRTAAADG